MENGLVSPGRDGTTEDVHVKIYSGAEGRD
jgi:hypothetical protein